MSTTPIIPTPTTPTPTSAPTPSPRATLLLNLASVSIVAVDAASAELSNNNNSSSRNSSSSPIMSASTGCSATLTATAAQEMPQWKKDLIQRRKINNSASRSMPASNSSSMNVAQPLRSPPPPQQQQQQQHEQLGLSSSMDLYVESTTETSQQKQAKSKLYQTPAITSSASSVLAAASSYSSSSCYSTSSCSSSALTTPTKEKSEKFLIGGHYTPPPLPEVAVSVGQTTATTQSSNRCERAGSKADDEVNYSYSVSTATVIIPTTTATATTTTAATTAGNVPIPKQRSLLYTTNTTTTSATTTPTPPANARSQSTNTHNHITKEQQEENVRAKLRVEEHEQRIREQECERNSQSYNNNIDKNNKEERNDIKATDAATAAAAVVAAMVNKSPNATTSNRGEVESGTVTSTVTAIATATATATTPTGAKPNQQSHTKCETEQNSAASQVNHFNILCTSAQQQPQAYTNAFSSGSSISSVGISASASGGVSIDKNCKTKISEKLQNNQFIKNQQQQQQQQQRQNFVLPIKQQISKYKQDINNSHTIDQQQQQQQLLSPTKITANFSGTKTKMVAVQEMKKNTTQNGGHHHHHNHAHHHSHHHHQLVMGSGSGSVNTKRPQQPDVSAGVEVGPELDTSEDLKYGPGIVSKLRCRYLTLALRDSMEQHKQPLRRSTSLNTLLDRDDDEEVIDEADGDDEEDDDVAAVELRKPAETLAGRNATPVITAGSNSPTTPNATAKSSSFVKKPYPIGGYIKYTSPGVSDASNVGQNGGAGGGTLSSGQHQPMSPTPLLQRHSMATTSIMGSGGGGSVDNGSGSGSGNGTRSRHLKRGNEIMKRARSVEALLSEKSHWQSCNPLPASTGHHHHYHHHQQQQQQQQHNVTIEDKISNARERLHSGTDAMPPKRLTSIIDDTERPPPDLVKQTLKKFEASANRRPRVAQRTNGIGDVASKVANYKSIIKEQKPPIMNFHKPTTAATTTLVSPTKSKLLPGLSAGSKPSSVTGLQRKANGSGGSSNDLELQFSGSIASTPKQRSTAAAGVAATGDRTPDVVPRQHALMPGNEGGAAFDSPMTALTKGISQLVLESPEKSSSGGTVSNKARQSTEILNFGNDESLSMSSPVATSKSFVGGNAGVAASAKLAQQQQESDSSAVVVVDADIGNVNDSDDVEANVVVEHETKSSIVSSNNDENNDKNNDEDGNVDVDLSAGVDDKCVGRSGTSYADKDVDDKPSSASSTTTTTSSSLIAHDTQQQQQLTVGSAATSAGSGSREFGAAAKQITKSALENISKAGTTQEFKFTQQNLTTTTTNKLLNGCETTTTIPPTTTTRQIGVIRPLINTASTAAASVAATTNIAATTTQSPLPTSRVAAAATTTTTTHQHIQHTPPALTTREIEKNRINEMKKTHALAADGVAAVTSSPLGGAVGFETIIKQNTSGSSVNSAISETDAATGSPIWALRKRRQGGNGGGTTGAAGPIPADNSMVFNFSKSTKEVPDYIESDVVIFRRKRELPKPNESGFVLLGDLSVETSTDPDCDDFSMCPPSPCDVEFENANIVIDGKSSIRQKPKEFSFRVQFNDTLTSTFEYPSEASMVIDDSSIVDNYSNIDDTVGNFQHLMLADEQNRQQQPSNRHHHHVAVDEIIQLPTATSSPTSTASSSATSASATSTNILGNLPLASLGLYTPIKGSTIDNIFQLGVTRPYHSSNEAGNGNGNGSATAPKNGSVGNIFNGFGEGSSIMGIGEGLIKNVDDGLGSVVDGADGESDSLQYLKPANDELNIAYSEGTQKTDLLY